MKRHKRHVHYGVSGYMMSPQFLGFLPQQVDTDNGSEAGVGTDSGSDAGTGDSGGQP